MGPITVNRRALSVSVAAALLAGCGALPLSQPAAPINASARTTGNRVQPASSSYQVLHEFHGARGICCYDGAHPQAGLVNVNGRLYGTTSDGGEYHVGTVFSITTGGTEKVYNLGGGNSPRAGLIDVKGKLYGTTTQGGIGNYGPCPGGLRLFGCGVVYSITPTGKGNALYAFAGDADGASPEADLIDVNGILYGTTTFGGSGCASGGCGTVFRITTAGVEKVLYAFKGGSDGEYPSAGLLEVNGTLYGTTPDGGDLECKSGIGCGTVYSLGTSGAETVLYRFAGGSDGAHPAAGLIDVNGTLYGTTSSGGSGSCNGGCGTVYAISTSGAETVLYNFKGHSDGERPEAGLIDVGGVMYGTTEHGGGSRYCSSGCGTVYSVTATGTEKVLHRFTGPNDGSLPLAGLASVNGTLFGTTTGALGRSKDCRDFKCGSVFALTP